MEQEFDVDWVPEIPLHSQLEIGIPFRKAFILERLDEVWEVVAAMETDPFDAFIHDDACWDGSLTWGDELNSEGVPVNSLFLKHGEVNPGILQKSDGAGVEFPICFA